jgi:hypothetical protein
MVQIETRFFVGRNRALACHLSVLAVIRRLTSGFQLESRSV